MPETDMHQCTSPYMHTHVHVWVYVMNMLQVLSVYGDTAQARAHTEREYEYARTVYA